MEKGQPRILSIHLPAPRGAASASCWFRIKKLCLPGELLSWGAGPAAGCTAEGHSQGAFAWPSLRPQRQQQMVGGSSHSEASLFRPCLASPSSQLRKGRRKSASPSSAIVPPLPGSLQATRGHALGRPRGWRALASPFPAPPLRVWDPLPSCLCCSAELRRACPSRRGGGASLTAQKAAPSAPLPPRLPRREGRSGRTAEDLLLHWP